MQPRIIVHGGAGTYTDEHLLKSKPAIQQICHQAHEFLKSNSAKDTAIFAVQLLEDCPLFNAGTGSRLQTDGKARMTAAFMESTRRKFSAVINIENIQNPINVAAKLQEEKNSVLGGPEATKFAHNIGCKEYDPITEEKRLELNTLTEEKFGTVGVVVLDSQGKIAAATSTGGTSACRPGRVGDVASPAGTYCDTHAGVSCTGRGEDIQNAVLASRIVFTAQNKTLQDAVKESFINFNQRKGSAGIIALDHNGVVVVHHNTPHMVFAYNKQEEIVTY